MVVWSIIYSRPIRHKKMETSWKLWQGPWISTHPWPCRARDKADTACSHSSPHYKSPLRLTPWWESCDCCYLLVWIPADQSGIMLGFSSNRKTGKEPGSYSWTLLMWFGTTVSSDICLSIRFYYSELVIIILIFYYKKTGTEFSCLYISYALYSVYYSGLQ